MVIIKTMSPSCFAPTQRLQKNIINYPSVQGPATEIDNCISKPKISKISQVIQ